jgi:phosphoserine phosphatase RsbU/P
MKNTDDIMDDDNSLLLKASAKRLFETLMEQTADRIYIKDKKSRFIAASQTLATMHKLGNRHDLEGKTDFDLFSIEHAQQAFDDEQEILRTGESIINKIEKETWDDGSVTWVSSSKAPLYLGSGKLAGIIGISRDVTSEKISQEKLAESEQRLREKNEIMRSDYESARKVQSVMIPGRVPVVQHIELGYLWEPMTSVGGDIISFPRTPSKCLLFFLGDVCGHGVAAAFYTVLIKYLTAQSAEVYADDPRQFLNSVNEQMIGRINEGFVTGLAGHFGTRHGDGSRFLFVANAGHRQVLVYRAQSKMIELIRLDVGVVMGIPGATASSVTKIELNLGDRFYAFTDGIVEASNPQGDEFGIQALIECFTKLSTEPINATLKEVYKTISEFTGSPDQQDDITMLGFEMT